MKILYNEDFKDFPLEELPYDKGHTALGEYHSIINEGYFGNWYDPICNHQWRSQDGSWIITNYDNKRFLTQNRGDYCFDSFKSVSSLLIIKDTFYSEYNLSVKIRSLDIRQFVGVVFSYITSRNYYSVSFKENMIRLYYRNQEDIKIISEANFDFDEYELYDFKIHVGKNVEVFINGILILEGSIDYKHAKCGIIAKGASRFTDFIISMGDNDYENHLKIKKEIHEKLTIKQKEYAPVKLMHKINLKNGGSARQFRIAHKENGEIFFIFAQHQKMIMRDSYAQISCLSAIDLSGNIMWQIGESNNSNNNTQISCDLPFQVSDINNDAKDELIYSRDFYVYIIDAETGKEIKKMKTPKSDDLFGLYPYSRLNVDAIRVADFRGLGYQGDFIIKDRYKNVFAYDGDFNLLWRYNLKNTGHFPYIYDFDGDGFDEMFVGYSYVDHDGTIKWSLPIDSDHTDEIIYINTLESEPKRLYLASGNEGFNICNMDGSIYKHNEIGHAQRISIAKYDKNKEGLQICVTSFWGANDIIYMFDAHGNKLCEKEMECNGNVITPVAYDGNNVLILSSSFLGLLDSKFDSVVKFPNDGHPTLCADAIDIDNDGISEILLWDQYNMYIYKSSEFKTNVKYEKYPDNAMSNYRGEFLKNIE